MNHYIGNGAYCYANSTAMLLAAIGESVAPATIEVLTGVGLGAVWVDDWVDFSGYMGTPDRGSAFCTIFRTKRCVS